MGLQKVHLIRVTTTIPNRILERVYTRRQGYRSYFSLIMILERHLTQLAITFYIDDNASLRTERKVTVLAT